MEVQRLFAMEGDKGTVGTLIKKNELATAKLDTGV